MELSFEILEIPKYEYTINFAKVKEKRKNILKDF